MTRRLYIGTVDADGKVDPHPVVADFDAEGRLLAWQPLAGHEPHSTIFTPTLLSLKKAEKLKK